MYQRILISFLQFSLGKQWRYLFARTIYRSLQVKGSLATSASVFSCRAVYWSFSEAAEQVPLNGVRMQGHYVAYVLMSSTPIGMCE